MFKKFLLKKLSKRIRQFFANHPHVRLVGVTGSAGKQSAKLAIATVLSSQYNVRMFDDEPRSRIDTMLQLLGIDYPGNKHNLLAWMSILNAARKRAKGKNENVQVIVQEFAPYDIGYHDFFKSVVVPDIAVVTSVTSGRTKGFSSLELVAQEMLTLANNSRHSLINRDDIDGRFSAYITTPNFTTYGTSAVAEYYFDEHDVDLKVGHQGRIFGPEIPRGLGVSIQLFGEHNLRPAVASAAVGTYLAVNPDNIVTAINSLRPLPGRMQPLWGADGTLLIDDTYSSTPLTAMAAMQSLYKQEAPQKIAVLGSMNGLGDLAPSAHQELGRICNPNELNWVVTVGDLANQYLAPAAKQNGCQVKVCKNALEAGGFVRQQLHRDGVCLFKGSDKGIYLEEAVKINLHSTADEKKLVRQTADWLDYKDTLYASFRD